MNVKQILLGTWAGELALAARHRLELVRAAVWHPERAGTVANDYLAERLVTSLCQPNACFLDVGAHIGSVIASVLRNQPSCSVIAIEAVPEKAKALESKFPQATIHSCAVGSEEGEAVFYVDTRRPGFSSLMPHDAENESLQKIHVEIQTLDNLVPSDADVDVMKMDIEGAELQALRGAHDLLTRSRPLILFESGPGRGSQDDKRALYKLLQEHHYIIVTPNRLAHNGDGLTENGFLESHHYPRRTTNYFAVHQDRRIEVRDRARNILRIKTQKT